MGYGERDIELRFQNSSIYRLGRLHSREKYDLWPDRRRRKKVYGPTSGRLGLQHGCAYVAGVGQGLQTFSSIAALLLVPVATATTSTSCGKAFSHEIASPADFE